MTEPTDVPIPRGAVGWYLPTTFNPALLKDAVESSPFLVMKGKGGAKQLDDLARLSLHPTVFLDPAQNEAKKVIKATSIRMGWAELQSHLKVAGLVSPGAYLYPAQTKQELARVVRAERAWVAETGSDGFCAICVDADFLRSRTPELVKQLASLDCRVWLTLSHRNDPLSLQGSVAALVDVVRACPNVALMRTDIAGVGAVAFGAAMASIGLSGGMRHSPDGGGGAGNDIPVVFSRTLQSFKKTNVLEGWVQRDADILYDLNCLEWCCEGGSILRYADPALAFETAIHNMVSLRAVAEEVMGLDASARAAKFVALARTAWFQHERLSDSIDTIKAEPQLRQWAQVD